MKKKKKKKDTSDQKKRSSAKTPPDNTLSKHLTALLIRRLRSAINKGDTILKEDNKNLDDYLYHVVGEKVSSLKKDQLLMLDKDTDLYKVRRNTIRIFKKDAESYLNWLPKKFKKEFSKDSEKWPMKWMLNDKAVKEFLEKKKNRNIMLLMNYLWENIMDKDECEKLAEEKNTGNYLKNNVKRPFAFVVIENIERMKEKLNISQDLIRKHLKELTNIGILKKFGKSGSRGHMIYAIGYHLPYPDPDTGIGKTKVIHFFTMKMKGKLLKFDPYRVKKKRKSTKYKRKEV